MPDNSRSAAAVNQPYTFGDRRFIGINTNTQPSLLEAGQIQDAVNLWNDGGALAVRPGWQAQLSSAETFPIYQMIAYRKGDNVSNEIIFVIGSSSGAQIKKITKGGSTSTTLASITANAADVKLVQHGKYIYGVPGSAGFNMFRTDGVTFDYVPSLKGPMKNGRDLLTPSATSTTIPVKAISGISSIDNDEAVATFGNKFNTGTGDYELITNTSTAFGYTFEGDTSGAVPGAPWSTSGAGTSTVRTISSLTWHGGKGSISPYVTGSSNTKALLLDAGGDFIFVTKAVPDLTYDGVTSKAGMFYFKAVMFNNDALSAPRQQSVLITVTGLDVSGAAVPGAVFTQVMQPAIGTSPTDWKKITAVIDFRAWVTTMTQIRFRIETGNSAQGTSDDKGILVDNICLYAMCQNLTSKADDVLNSSNMLPIRVQQRNSSVLPAGAGYVKNLAVRLSGFSIPDSDWSNKDYISMKMDFPDALKASPPYTSLGIKGVGATAITWSGFGDYDPTKGYMSWNIYPIAQDKRTNVQYVYVRLEQDVSTLNHNDVIFNIGELVVNGRLTSNATYDYLFTRWYSSDQPNLRPPTYRVNEVSQTGMESDSSNSSNSVLSTKAFSSMSIILNPDESLPYDIRYDTTEISIQGSSPTSYFTSVVPEVNQIDIVSSTSGSFVYRNTGNSADITCSIVANTPFRVDTANALWYAKTFTGDSYTVTFTNGSANISGTFDTTRTLLNSTVKFTTTGALPTNFAVNTVYYIVSVTSSIITLSATKGGAPIIAGSIPSGVHTMACQVGTIYMRHSVPWGTFGTKTVTIASGNVLIVTPNQFRAGDPVKFTTTVGNIVANTTYYVIATGLTKDQFSISTTYGGTVLTPSASGTTTLNIHPQYSHALVYRRSTTVFTDGRFRLIACVPLDAGIVGTKWTSTFTTKTNGSVSWNMISLADNVPDGDLFYEGAPYDQGQIYQQGRDPMPSGASCIAVHQNRLWTVKDNTVYASWILDVQNEFAVYSTWVPDFNDPSNAYKGTSFTISSKDDNEKVVALLPYGGDNMIMSNSSTAVMLILRENSVLPMLGYNPSTFTIQAMIREPSSGCIAPNAVVSVAGRLLWQTPVGMVEFNDGVIEQRSIELRKMLSLDKSMNAPDLDNAAYRRITYALHNQRLYIFAPGVGDVIASSTDPQSANTYVYVLDFRTMGWTRWRPLRNAANTDFIRFTNGVAMSAGNDTQEFYVAGNDGNSGQIYKLTGTRDRGTGGTVADIPWSMLSRQHGQTYSEGIAYYNLNRVSQVNLHYANNYVTVLSNFTASNTTIVGDNDFVVGDTLVYDSTIGNVTVNTTYFVIARTNTTYQISTSSGGTAVSPTVSGYRTAKTGVSQQVSWSVQNQMGTYASAGNPLGISTGSTWTFPAGVNRPVAIRNVSRDVLAPLFQVALSGTTRTSMRLLGVHIHAQDSRIARVN